jgi:HlyD family secretion protein
MVQNSKLKSQLSPKSALNLFVIISIITFLLTSGISIYIVKHLQNTTKQERQTPTTQLPQLTTVTALGWIEPKGKVIQLSATTSTEGSRVEQLLIQEGDTVKAGQRIAILDSRDRFSTALKEAQEQLKVEQANLKRIQAGAQRGEITAQKATVARLEAQRQGDIEAQVAKIERLQAEVGNAKAENQRYQGLYKQGAISTSLWDSKRLTLETSQKNLQEARAQLNRIRLTSQEQIEEAKAKLDRIVNVPKEDVEVAKAEVNRALASVERAKANLQQAYVTSPQDGRVFQIHVRPGELISTNGIADIGQTSQMYVIAEVYESDINKVRSGQSVQIVGDFLPIELRGTVERKGLQVKRQNVINTDPLSNIDNRVVEVHIRLDPSSSQKAANLTNMQVRAVIQL